MGTLRFTAFSFLAPVVLGALTACGGGSSGGSSGDPVALCKQGCEKTISLCFADAGSLATMAQSSCMSSCTSSTSNTTTCTNSSAIVSAYQACLNKTTCNDLMNCVQTVPACQGGAGKSGGSSGSGGTSGSGGASGSGGTSGGAGTSSTSGGTCADLLACCNKAGSMYQSACMQAYSAAMPSGDSACGIVLSGAKSTFCP
jgi:hypothetical protein